MKDDFLLSIIINSYNSDKYLEQCLESVIKQLDINIELIVVDDSSLDNSQNIIKDKLKNLKNVSYFFVEHSGISNSRNYGIKKATGKYLMFIDGDDYISDDAISKIINHLKKSDADITLLNTIKYYEDYDYYEKEIMTINETENITERMLIDNKIFARQWRFICKKDMIINNNLSFPSNLVYEDEEWVPKIIYYSNYIDYLNEYIYIYRKRKGSITTVKSIDYITNLMSIVERTYNWSLNCDHLIKYINYSLSRCIRNIFSSLDYLTNLNDIEKITNWYDNNCEMIFNILEYNQKLKLSISQYGPHEGVKVYKRNFREKYLTKKEKTKEFK